MCSSSGQWSVGSFYPLLIPLYGVVGPEWTIAGSAARLLLPGRADEPIIDKASQLKGLYDLARALNEPDCDKWEGRVIGLLV
jgi:hypothetical protein